MNKIDDVQDEIETQAAEWVIRLGADRVTHIDKKNFELWQSTSLRHREAFKFASHTWNELKSPENGAVSPRRTESVPLPRPHIASSQLRRHTALALAACLVLFISAGFVWFGNPLVALSADYVTAPGEQQLISLSDGSTVELGSGSALSVDFSARERRVELLSGMAYFTVAPKTGQERRPFVVTSGNGTAEALGTQFAVNNLDEAVEVAVTQHTVQVAVHSDSAQPAEQALLSSGQVVRYSARGKLGMVETKDLDQTIAWRRGKLIFNDVPLSQVVSELNRYRRGRIVIGRPSLAAMHVSGVFDTRQLNDALERIAGELGVNTTSLPPLITVIY